MTKPIAMAALLAGLTARAPAADQVLFVKFNSPCALSISARGDVARAIRDKDEEAMEGLIARGKAIRLLKGTKFAQSMVDSGFSYGTVRSGRETGRDCHIPSVFLQSEKP